MPPDVQCRRATCSCSTSKRFVTLSLLALCLSTLSCHHLHTSCVYVDEDKSPPSPVSVRDGPEDTPKSLVSPFSLLPALELLTSPAISALPWLSHTPYDDFCGISLASTEKGRRSCGTVTSASYTSSACNLHSDGDCHCKTSSRCCLPYRRHPAGDTSRSRAP